MSLSIIQILQAMFKAAEENVGLGESAYVLGCKMSTVPKTIKNEECRADLQSTVSSSANQLEYLGDKFDFTNATGAEFDVFNTIFTGDFLTNLRMECPHGIDCAEV